MVQHKPGQNAYNPSTRCQCGGRWIIPKRNGTFSIGRGKRGVGRRPIRVYGPVIQRHVPFRGNGAFSSASAPRMREFQICALCGQRELGFQAERNRSRRKRMGLPVDELETVGYVPPKRSRDYSKDAEKRKMKARRHKARQARR